MNNKKVFFKNLLSLNKISKLKKTKQIKNNKIS